VKTRSFTRFWPISTIHKRRIRGLEMRTLVTIVLLSFSCLAFSAEVPTPQSMANRFFETFLKVGGEPDAIRWCGRCISISPRSSGYRIS
jgi:hypothetical protein